MDEDVFDFDVLSLALAIERDRCEAGRYKTDIPAMAGAIPGADALYRRFTASERTQRSRLKKALRGHPGIMLFLDAIGTAGQGHRLRDGQEDPHRNPYVEIRFAEQFVTHQSIVAAPRAGLFRRRMLGQHDGSITSRPQYLFVVDCDEVKHGTNRPLAELVAMMEADGCRPLCVVPSRTSGNYHFYFLLAEETWKYLSAPPHWGVDPDFHRGTGSWNPVFRTFTANRAGEVTWWHPCLAEGEVPIVDPQRFQGHPVVRSSGDSSRVVRSSEVSKSTGQRWDRLWTTSDELEALMRQTYPGHRHAMLRGYVNHWQAKEARRLGRDLTLAEVRAITRNGNGRFPVPRVHRKLEALAKSCWENKLYEHKKRIRAKRKDLTVEEVYGVLDKFVVLQCAKVNGSRLGTVGVIYRYGSVKSHPDYARYRATSGRADYATLAKLEEGLTVTNIKNIVTRYADFYKAHPTMGQEDERWTQNIVGMMSGG